MAKKQDGPAPDRVEWLLKPYRVTDGKKFRLRDVKPGDTRGIKDRDEAESLLQKGVQWLAEKQDRLYAQDQWGVLLIFQAMDAAGKDGAIKHVMSGINPQGCQVFSFKSPSTEELDHDFMWRTSRSLPERGRIGIFNRSYYEEVLAVRVHPEFLAKQRLPKKAVGKDIWEDRYEDIAAFERYMARNGYLVLKFFLHVSKEEQKGRFLARLDEPEKNWKFSVADARERGFWDDYMKAYEDAIRHTAADHAPWYVVPADKKWFARLVIAAAIHDGLARLDLKYPVVDDAKRHELAEARAVLEGQNGKPDAPASSNGHAVRAALAAAEGAGDGKRRTGKKAKGDKAKGDKATGDKAKSAKAKGKRRKKEKAADNADA